MSGNGPGDLRSFFGKGASVSSKTQSGNKPAPPKTPKGSGSKKAAAQDPDTHKDGGPKVVVEKKQAGSSSKKATSKHFANGKASSTPTVVKDDDDDVEMVDAPRSASAKKKQSAPANSTKTPIVLDESDDDDEVVAVKPKAKPRASGSGAAGGSASKRKKKAIESSEEESSEEEVKPAKKTPASSSKGKGKARASTSKRTKEDDDFIDDDDDDPKPKKKAAPRKSNTKPSAPKKAKVDDEVNGDDAQAKKEEKPKPKWIPGQQRAGPIAPGSKVIPEGAPNCLAGLTLVFTGELDSLGREEAMSLAKRYGARTTTGPSSKTSYVIVGTDAGPKKLETIEKYNLKTLDEDGFLALIASRGEGEVDEKFLKKQKEEEEKVILNAKSMGPAAPTKADEQRVKDMLWTVKYAPQAVKDICGNKGQVQKLQDWLHNWQKNRESGFKKPGKDGTGISRAMMIYGPPGIGKTTAAHLVAKLEGYDVIELNASDTRSKKLLQAEVSNTTGQHSIAGFYKPGADGANVNKNNLVIIMDEVDGMSAGDRGGVGALSALVKKTQVPMVLIANDMSLPKMKPLKFGLHQLQFRRPTAAEIRSRMLSVAFREKLKIPGNVIDELVAGSQADIRQVINMMSTYKLGADDMNFDQGKAMARLNEKNSVTTPWTLMNKLFAPVTWAPNSGLSLAEKEGIYFVDHDMLPMFVQDSYLRYNPSLARNDHSPTGDLKKLRLVSKAADAISDGDLISGMIRGAQQWSLMPLHAQMSCVTPASHMHGLSSGGYSMGFPAWFGKNSTQGRLARLLGEVQIRMRLKVSGDRREIRQAYLPALFPRLFDPLVEDGVDGVEGVIELMDEYYLGREEWDTVVELLTLGEDVEGVMKKVPTQVKTAFTRTFNKRNHPIPYHKGDASTAKPQKKVGGEAAPDLEDVIEVDESSEGEAAADEDGSDVAKDLAKDKLIKNKAKPAPKPKGGKAGAAAGNKPKGKGKGKKVEDDSDEE